MILPIQYLRGIAALMVVWHHALGLIPGLNQVFPWDFGVSGVDIFFVVSGFIMVVTTANSTVTPWQFLRRRIVRVVPLYWLLTLALVAMTVAIPHLFKTVKVEPTTLMQSLLFIPHFSLAYPGVVSPLLVPGWTLNFEMFFYLVFGAMLFLPSLRLRLGLMGVAFGVMVGVGAALGPFASAVAQTYTHPMLLEFVAGTLLGAWWVRGEPRLPLWASIVAILVGAGLLVLRDHPILGAYTQIIGAVLVVLGALGATAYAGRINWWLALGDSSYSLYLTHSFTLAFLRPIWVRLLPDGQQTPLTLSAVMLVSILICALVGWLSFLWIEAPLSRRLSRRRQGTGALAAG